MKVLIVDDETPARVRLKRLLDELSGYETCAEAKNGIEALELAQTQHPDIVLMDIRMPAMDGLEAARHLATLEQPPALIFTTAYGEYALDAFQAHAAGYLLKPIRKEHLQQALAGARIPNRAQLAGLADTEGNARTHICARLGERLELIPLTAVFYFQAEQKYVTVRHRHGEVLVEESLKSLETEFDSRFLRIHRNALVAKAHLMGLIKTPEGRFQIQFNGIDDQLEISRRHLSEARR
ncbi:MAG: response regulator transcription factor, partial [bacterium]|nr:response regulator transcription factor [bacterium]